jgi:ubiquinone/menaquinone biosynthesis C-methylase UbiE
MKKNINLNKEEKEKVINQWNNSEFSTSLDLYSFQPVRDYFSSLITNNKDETAEDNWFEKWFIDKHLKDKIPIENCLTLCCGHGERDRRLAKMGVFQHCLGLDVNPQAIENAKKNASKRGYSNMLYEVSDLNVDHLKENSYDLVYVGGGMHHILNLEHLVNQIYKALKPGGLLVCDEYVGPAYNNLTNRHREIINSSIHLIPKRLRNTAEENFIPNFWKKSIIRTAFFLLYKLGSINIGNYKVSPNCPSYKKWIFRIGGNINSLLSRIRNHSDRFKYGQLFDISPERIKAGDPSEGIRSDEIIPIIKQKFEDTKVHYYNGSIIGYALDEKFFSNYNANSKKDRLLFDLLIDIEKKMIEIGEISSIHAIIVSQKPHKVN